MFIFSSERIPFSMELFGEVTSFQMVMLCGYMHSNESEFVLDSHGTLCPFLPVHL